MIDALITWSLKNRFLVVCATLFVIAFGIKAVCETPVDAIPDLSENQVIVFADWPKRAFRLRVRAGVGSLRRTYWPQHGCPGLHPMAA